MFCRAVWPIKVAVAIFSVATILAATSFLVWLSLIRQRRREFQTQTGDPDGQQLLPVSTFAPAGNPEERHVLLGPLGREGAQGALPGPAEDSAVEEQLGGSPSFDGPPETAKSG